VLGANAPSVPQVVVEQAAPFNVKLEVRMSLSAPSNTETVMASVFPPAKIGPGTTMEIDGTLAATVSVKFCTGLVPIVLCAVNVIGNVPVAVGVPLRNPVVVLKGKSPAGRVPLSAKVGAGYPVAVTVNDCELPVVKVTLLALVIVGASFTVNVKFCIGLNPEPFNGAK
jgi:hypothetical protein